MIDRLVHHAGVIALKDDSYRIKKTATSAASPPSRPTTNETQAGQFSIADS